MKKQQQTFYIKKTIQETKNKVLNITNQDKEFIAIKTKNIDTLLEKLAKDYNGKISFNYTIKQGVRVKSNVLTIETSGKIAKNIFIEISTTKPVEVKKVYFKNRTNPFIN